jgi:DNA-binding NarL/FixJ family response regulator
VLRGMADGESNAEIGREPYASADTVRTHARRLFRKLVARDRAHTVASASRAGLVSWQISTCGGSTPPSRALNSA